jgi:hypothetical protein
MVNGQWEVNQEAFDELAECVRRCNIRAEQKKDKPATLPLPIAGPADPKAIDEAEKMPYPNGDVEQLVQRIIDGSPKKPGTSPVDELGFQTIYAHPHAKCIRIVTPHTAVLINLQPKLPKTV